MKGYRLQSACANCKKCLIRHVQDDPTQFLCVADGLPPPNPADSGFVVHTLKGKKLQQRIVAIEKRAAWDKSHQVKAHGVCGLYEPVEEDEGRW